jgi:hypothetical protein
MWSTDSLGLIFSVDSDIDSVLNDLEGDTVYLELETVMF